MDARKAQHLSPSTNPDYYHFEYTQETFVPELPAFNEYQDHLKQNDFEMLNYLNARQINTRFNILAVFISISLKQLLLRPKTVDIGIRLFDYFYIQKIRLRGYEKSTKSKAQKPKIRTQGRFLENKETSKVVLVVCLFLAAKYNQVYPPGINDFLYLLQHNFTRSDVIQLERQIVTTTQFGFRNSTMSDWYTSISGQILPEWALMIYCHCLGKAEHLARAVYYVSKMEKDDSSRTSSAKLSRILAILGVKKQKQRKTGNHSRTAMKPKVESNQQANLSEEDKEKLNVAVKQLKGFLESKNLEKKEKKSE